MDRMRPIVFLGIVVILTSLVSVIAPAFATIRASLVPSEPILKSPSELPIMDTPTAGKQYVISITVENTELTEHEYVLLVEVRNSDDITLYLNWQGGMLPPEDRTQVGVSWLPLNADTYTIRTFPITGFENPELLGPLVERSIVVEN